MNPLFSVVSLLMVSGFALAYKSGAPAGVCESMIPEHGVPPQNTTSPYTLSVDKTNIKPGGSVTLKITGPGGKLIKGFFVQARNNTNHIQKGVFTKASGTKVIDCPPGVKNAITHSSPDDKKSVSVTYKPLEHTPFHFLATIVQDGGTFWVHQKSQTVKFQ